VSEHDQSQRIRTRSDAAAAVADPWQKD